MRKNVDSDDGGAGGVEEESMGRGGGGVVVVDERRETKWKVSRQVSAVMALMLPEVFLHTRAFQSAPAKKTACRVLLPQHFLALVPSSEIDAGQTGCVGRLGLVTGARE